METVFLSSARDARAHTESLEMHCFQAHIELPGSHERVFNCLRDLTCLMHWWPHAQSLRPLPPGLCNVGDMAILRARQDNALLRVLAFKPGRRMVLAIGFKQGLVVLDLAVRQVDAGCKNPAQVAQSEVAANQPLCQVQFRVETPQNANSPRSARLGLWLGVLGSRAVAALEQHLLVLPRVARLELPRFAPAEHLRVLPLGGAH